MNRRLLNLLTLLSLVLCIAVTGLWLRSYVAFDWVKLGETRARMQVETHPGIHTSPQLVTVDRINVHCAISSRGKLGYVSADPDTGYLIGLNRTETSGSYSLILRPRTNADRMDNDEVRYRIDDMYRRWNRYPEVVVSVAGFEYVLHDPSWTLGKRILMPYWFAFVPTAAAPAWWLVSRFRRRRAPGLCRRCGYDLRATPDRCPECGTAASRAREKGATAPGAAV